MPVLIDDRTRPQRSRPFHMPAKSVKVKEKEGQQTEESMREKRRLQKWNRGEHIVNVSVNEESFDLEEKTNTSDADSLLAMLQFDLIFDPTTPATVENALETLKNERTELHMTGRELEKSWDNFHGNMNIYAEYASLCHSDDSICPALVIIELWRSLRSKIKSGQLAQKQKSGSKYNTQASADPHDLELAAKLSAWMDDTVRKRIDGSAEYDRCRPLYDKLAQQLDQLSARCVRMRTYLADLCHSLKTMSENDRTQIQAVAWSDLACPTEVPLPLTATAFRFANPAQLLSRCNHGSIAELFSPSVELAGRFWTAALLVGESPDFIGLFVEAHGTVEQTHPINLAEDVRDCFSVRISVRRGTVDQVNTPMTRFQRI